LIEWGDTGRRTKNDGAIMAYVLTPTGRTALLEATKSQPAAYGSGSFDDPAWDDPKLAPKKEEP
jgi:hypothetical protein